MHNWNGRVTALRTGLMALAMIALLPFTVLADETDTFVSGTKVNGLSISGMSVDEARAYMEGFYASSYKLTVRTKGGRQEVIQGSDIGYQASFTDGLQTILDAQNAGGRVSGPEVDNTHRISMTSSYDSGALDDRIQALSCISGGNITVTADAYISGYQEEQPFTIIPEVYGNSVDTIKTSQVIHQAVSTGVQEINLEEAGCYVSVQVTKDTPALIDLCNVMNQCREMKITYVFGQETADLDGSVISTWLTGTENGQIGVDHAAAEAFVQSLKDRFDTAGTTRTFQSASGREAQVTGAYGYSIDKAAETEALIGMIRTGQTQPREPQYASTGAARDGYDWGATYVEVDLTGQHVYMIKDGAVVWDAPCVTGNVSKGYTTPAGLFTLTYKERDRVLRGKKLENGEYEYESPVKYWMPFNGGIGLHDADWRSKFGGSIYQSSGSHGCINLPPAKVPELYELVYKGIPVICYN